MQETLISPHKKIFSGVGGKKKFFCFPHSSLFNRVSEFVYFLNFAKLSFVTEVNGTLISVGLTPLVI